MTMPELNEQSPVPVDRDRNFAALERIAIVGMGAMGKRVLAALRERGIKARQLACLVPAHEADSPNMRSVGIEVFHDVTALVSWNPTLCVECAGHAAVDETVIPLLERGVDAILVSVGALASAPLREKINRAMTLGDSALTLVSGAIGGIDALRAARMGGLDSVRYTGRKPPHAWRGSPAELQFDLLTIDKPTVVFEGTAGESARLFPKNANVTAAVALAGIGFEKTTVTMMADPGVAQNVHEIEAVGAFGRLSIRLENNPLPDNPRTSWLAAMSIEDAVIRRLEHSI
ncbi:aspartate dehydrogenase [Burkholderia sp. S171]|uniref:aspartate dehydrogenase n=1 Tax=Burkholderia sp. S171 TaxID=1641860 RepID=UPI0020B11456|nr:aspartate dehydrogenase [Burkholderia sp. S171]